jgi:hypothetical protein
MLEYRTATIFIPRFIKIRQAVFILRQTEREIIFPIEVSWGRDSVVGIATSYGLDDRGVGVRVPVG